MKQHKRKLLVTSILIILPILAGLFLWNRLPDILTTHWSIDGTGDGQGGKLTFVLLPYVVFLPLHWLCVLLTLREQEKRQQTRKAMSIIFWILPVISLFCGVITYATAFGKTWNVAALLPATLGVLFLVLGNYMPKIRKNRFIGVRLPWTMSNDENWSMTHRLCGRLWVIGGVLLLLSLFLPETVLLPVTLVIMIAVLLIPMVYSYCLYRKQLRNGETEKISSRFGKLSVVVTVVVLAAALVLMVSGRIDVHFNDTELVVDSTYWQPLSVEYDVIDSVEYLEQLPVGVRTHGFGSAKLLLGLFTCDEYGNYIRYTYSGCECGVLIRSNDQVLIVNASTSDETKAIYQELLVHIG